MKKLTKKEREAVIKSGNEHAERSEGRGEWGGCCLCELVDGDCQKCPVPKFFGVNCMGWRVEGRRYYNAPAADVHAPYFSYSYGGDADGDLFSRSAHRALSAALILAIDDIEGGKE